MPSTDFRTIVNSRGVHHNCHYDIMINVPPLVVKTLNESQRLTMSGSTIKDILNAFCTEVNIPSTSLASVPVRLGGESIEIPYDRIYGEFQTTFYIDASDKSSGGITFKTITAWLDTVYPPFTRNFAYPDEYTTDININMYAFNRDKNNMIMLKIIQAWPSNIQAAQLSGRAGNEPSAFVVTWKYRYMLPEALYERATMADVDAFIESNYDLASSKTTSF